VSATRSSVVHLPHVSSFIARTVEGVNPVDPGFSSYVAVHEGKRSYVRGGYKDG